jgi:hypothetical protein
VPGHACATCCAPVADPLLMMFFGGRRTYTRRQQ